MHTTERAGDALPRTMSVKSIRTVATLIDVNFHVITKAWFPVVIRIVIIGDSYDFPILGFVRLLRFLGQPGSHSSKNRRRLGCLGQCLQSRNDSDSSDQIVKIADRLGFLE